MSFPREEEEQLRACVTAISEQARTLATATQSNLVALSALHFARGARAALWAKDWGAAQEALHHAVDTIAGGYGLRAMPCGTARWLTRCEEALW
jgi:hypothetical protein